MPKLLTPVVALALATLLAGCAHSPVSDPQDPLEPMNRKIYAFNETADKYVAQPVARGYVAAVPAPLRTGVSNFFDNLTYPTVIINDLLQAKFRQAGLDTTRFLMNLTFGLVGFLDPATMVGLQKNDEDFGQTLGYWGVGPGWYLMLPILGPSTNRDLVGRGADTFTEPQTYADGNGTLYVSAARVVDSRAQLLGSEGMLRQQLDPYIFVRSLYLGRRQSLVYDGNPPKEEIDWGDDE